MSTIRPSDVREGLVSHNSLISELLSGISNLENSINSYTGESELQGQAFTSHKAYMTEGHMTFLRKYSMALETLKEANNCHISAIGNLIEPYYNETQIENEISNLQWQIRAIDNSLLNRALDLVGADLQLFQNRRSDLSSRVSELELKLERLRSYLAATRELYSSAESQFAEASRLLMVLETAARCPETGSVTMLSVDDAIGIVGGGSSWFHGPGTSMDSGSVAAWLGWVGARVDGAHGYAGAEVFFGRATADWGTSFNFMGTETRRLYVPGSGWEEKEVFSLINTAVSASASVALVTGNAEAGVGCDLAGISVGAYGAVGKAVAEGDLRFNIGEDGVNVYAGGRAKVAAVQGRASGTINILGLQINAHVGGYAGAVGVQGRIGIVDNQFVMEGGLAALLGVSGGISIGFNDTGVNAIASAAKTAVNTVASAATTAVNTVANAATTAVNAVAGGIQAAGNAIGNFFSGR